MASATLSPLLDLERLLLPLECFFLSSFSFLSDDERLLLDEELLLELWCFLLSLFEEEEDEECLSLSLELFLSLCDELELE